MKKDHKLKLINQELIVKNQLDEKLFDRFQARKNKTNTIADHIKDFIENFISKSTIRAYQKDLAFFFNFLKSGGEIITHPSQISAQHFQVYRDWMIEKDYASASINRRLVAIRSFLKWCLATKLIEHNPLDAVKLPKIQTESPTLAFDDHEVVKMIEAPDINCRQGSTHRIVLVLLFSLGLRRSELSSIKLADFYQERGHVVLKIRGKGGKDRHLPINENVWYEIQNYLARLNHFGLYPKKEDYLIQTISRLNSKEVNQEKIDGSTIYRIIQKYKNELGINKRLSPHSCRATVISHLLDTQKTPIRDVAIFAGHSKITTTERYDKRRDALDNSAAYQVNYKDILNKNKVS
jgi:site-specific recombinase XerD